jgi:hypothetical protein
MAIPLKFFNLDGERGSRRRGRVEEIGEIATVVITADCQPGRSVILSYTHEEPNMERIHTVLALGARDQSIPPRDLLSEIKVARYMY